MTHNRQDRPDQQDRCSRQEAAQAALNTWDRVRATYRDEPARDATTNEPYDDEAWFDWYDHTFSPAIQAWSTAMDQLEQVLGPEFPGRYPWDFRPACEQIMAIHKTTADNSNETESPQ